jgi:integrase
MIPFLSVGGDQVANRRVNLTKRVMVEGSLRYCPVVESALGRVKQDVVSVNGREERHPEGTYYIDYKVDGKRIRESVGTNAQEAAARRDQKQVELAAKNSGLVVQEEATKHSLRIAIAHYLEEIKLTKKPKTYAAYSTALEYFVESCSKVYLEDVERKDLLKFHAFLRDEKEQSARSCWNKFGNVMSFLKAQGVRGLAKKNDWPSFTEEEPEIYDREDLDKFFAACDDEERLWYEFLLMTGMREQECMYTYWSDVNLNKHVVRVTHKPDRNWTPKAYKEREVPVPDKLVASLKEWKTKANKSCNPLFPRQDANRNSTCSIAAKPSRSVQAWIRGTSGCTNSGRRSRRGICGRASICARCSRGWVIRIWRAPCVT